MGWTACDTQPPRHRPTAITASLWETRPPSEVDLEPARVVVNPARMLDRAHATPRRSCAEQLLPVTGASGPRPPGWPRLGCRHGSLSTRKIRNSSRSVSGRRAARATSATAEIGAVAAIIMSTSIEGLAVVVSRLWLLLGPKAPRPEPVWRRSSLSVSGRSEPIRRVRRSRAWTLMFMRSPRDRLARAGLLRAARIPSCLKPVKMPKTLVQFSASGPQAR